MYRFILLVGACLAFGGCGADQPPSSSTESPDNKSAPKPELVSTTPDEPAADPIDGGLADLESKTRISIRYDRIVALEGGGNQRQVFVEMLGATAEDTDRLAAEIFESAGFNVRRGLVDENGIRLQYRKPGIEPLNVLIRSVEAGPPLKEDSATSSLYIKQLAD